MPQVSGYQYTSAIIIVESTGNVSYVITTRGINYYIVMVSAVPESYTIINGTQTVYTLTEKETYNIT